MNSLIKRKELNYKINEFFKKDKLDINFDQIFAILYYNNVIKEKEDQKHINIGLKDRHTLSAILHLFNNNNIDNILITEIRILQPLYASDPMKWPPRRIGGKNKITQYKLTKKKVKLSYKNKKIVRNIYLKNKKEYCKLNKKYVLLSKLVRI
jgi:hypothetical protein